MTAAQKRAADPARHVWVSASAGSGKTKVLTDRVLRLLLQGTAPHRILCLTYTKAAAQEMRHRLQKTLGEWAILSDERCRDALEALLQEKPSPATLSRARRLFAQVLDAPEGVRIQTIHSFCQGLLKRFPLEAGVAPNLEILDDQRQKELLREARHRLLMDTTQTDVQHALALLAEESALGTVEELLDDLVSKRRRFGMELELGHAQPYIDALWGWLGTSPHTTTPQLVARHFNYSVDELNALRELARACLDSEKPTSQTLGQGMADWCATAEYTEETLWAYACTLLTDKFEPRKKLPTVDVKKRLPHAEELLLREQARMQALLAEQSAIETGLASEALLTLFVKMMGIYTNLKAQRGVMDHDDSIMHSVSLLKQEGINRWVLYKLDGGLDHVLVDEAQDTSAEQWRIIKALTAEFFTESPEQGRLRSLFVVGDDKQSIYSFQGADPEAFDTMRAYFQAQAQRVEAPFERVRLATSFRSSPAVLSAVDAVFADEEARMGLDISEREVLHEANRSGAGGRVELWPAIAIPKSHDEDGEEGDESHHTTQQRPETAQARLFASTIRHWIRSRRMLASQGRPVEAGDILVLVRKRKRFVDALVQQLKRYGVPVAGADRMLLMDQLAVKDMLALCDALLLPEDDLNFAAMLRGPLFNWSDDALFTLAHGRGESSLYRRLQALAADANSPIHALCHSTRTQLQAWMARVDYQSPYALLHGVLYADGGLHALQARLGVQIIDPIEELLQLALNYAQDHAATLLGFVEWVRQSSTEIKRDMEQTRNEVRIMTVHGSKGLQAPIVMLADALDVGGRDESLIWTMHHNIHIALWPKGTSKLNPRLQTLKEAAAQAEQKERNRLLYVALTRAEDELYVGGWQAARAKKSITSWYEYVERGLRRLPHHERVAMATLHATPHAMVELLVQQPDGAPVDALIATHPQTVPPKSRQLPLSQDVWTEGLPVFLQQPLPTEPAIPRPLAPSMAEVVAPGLSPVSQSLAMQRGKLVHQILQWLPETPAAQRTEKLHRWLQHHAADWPNGTLATLQQQAIALLEHPDMQPFWTHPGYTEVPISGMLTDQNGATRIINAQVDRLIVSEHAVWVVDYKTSQSVPARVQDVANGYLRQMAAYRDVLRRIYPTRRVEALLIWTSGPVVMPLPDAVLDEHGLV